MSQLFRRPGRIPGLTCERSAYVWATLWVAAAFALRLALQPVFHQGQTYSLFWPGVVLAAYVLGRRPAAWATLLSGVLGFFAFATPQFSWKADPQPLTTLAFFFLNAAVAIYLITALTRALAELSASQGRAEAVADSHADLFRELNERISHHLRLVAGVLTLQAKGEPEPDVMRGLQKASERSVLMARVHRELAGRTEAPVDFDAFARGLMRSVCLARGDDIERVTIEPAHLWLPPEEATSLGMALAECVAALLSRRDCGLLRIRMQSAPSETRVLISELDEATGASQASLSSSYLLRAMVEQLGATIALRADGLGSALEITVPHFAAREDAMVEMARPAAGMVH